MLFAAEAPVADRVDRAPFTMTTRTKTAEELAVLVARFAASDGWMVRVRLRLEDRWYERLHLDPDYDIWAISWMPGQSTGFHDHGASSGAFVVATGVLEEHRPGEPTLLVPAGNVRAFGPDYAHDVRNGFVAPAVSIHAYSPPLSEMNEYELDGTSLVPRDTLSERTESLRRMHRKEAEPTFSPAPPPTIDQVLSAARSRLCRLTPDEAFRAVVESDAILVDIRPQAQRAEEGVVPEAIVIERNVLEWRLDPASSSRLAFATSHDLQVIVLCSEGYTSSLAAAALHDIGLWRATDVIGGFRAWHERNLPTANGQLAALDPA